MQWLEPPLRVWVVVVMLLCYDGMWSCLTHTSVIGWPKPWPANLALEGTESVDTDTVGTRSRISALIHICLSGGRGMKKKCLN